MTNSNILDASIKYSTESNDEQLFRSSLDVMTFSIHVAILFLAYICFENVYFVLCLPVFHNKYIYIYIIYMHIYNLYNIST